MKDSNLVPRLYPKLSVQSPKPLAFSSDEHGFFKFDKKRVAHGLIFGQKVTPRPGSKVP